MIIILIKLFFITFFAAEMIIALALMHIIYHFDKKVNKFNDKILKTQKPIKDIFRSIRILIKSFNRAFLNFKEEVRKKREEYILKFLKTSLIYGGIFFLKGKYRKMIMGYEFIREIYEGIKESS